MLHVLYCFKVFFFSFYVFTKFVKLLESPIYNSKNTKRPEPLNNDQVLLIFVPLFLQNILRLHAPTCHLPHSVRDKWTPKSLHQTNLILIMDGGSKPVKNTAKCYVIVRATKDKIKDIRLKCFLLYFQKVKVIITNQFVKSGFSDFFWSNSGDRKNRYFRWAYKTVRIAISSLV